MNEVAGGGDSVTELRFWPVLNEPAGSNRVSPARMQFRSFYLLGLVASPVHGQTGPTGRSEPVLTTMNDGD
ncbi:hypothetical protein PIB30_023957 [Stylosanthes scabra]|uniref:Uncharacterized protein n=1 Tax=Stylosanthes scabra TaxID=79078 RepID=A0ABU6XB40_9FABA|nr:hypothetical protein [Stylosanthes scabra]